MSKINRVDLLTTDWIVIQVHAYDVQSDMSDVREIRLVDVHGNQIYFDRREPKNE